MKITADNKLKKLIVVGDRVLIKPGKQSDKTASGLYLPPAYKKRKKFKAATSSRLVQAIRCLCRQMKTMSGKEKKIP